MRELTKKGVHFKWTEDHEEEFREGAIDIMSNVMSYVMSRPLKYSKAQNTIPQGCNNGCWDESDQAPSESLTETSA